MTARKDGKTWTADFYEDGRSGRRIRKKGFLTKSAAQRYESDYFATFNQTGRPLDDRLQRILGHSSITMTMRYAHMSPDHLESALRLSPLFQSRHSIKTV